LEFWHGDKMLGVFPAILALAKDVHGKCHGVHRIYLTPDGNKLSFSDSEIKAKKFYKARDELPPTSIQLWKPQRLMGVSEGMETAWGAHELYDVPVWAARDTHNLGLFTPPPEVKELLIFIDTDPPKLNANGEQVGLAGQRHGEMLLKRMADAGIEAKIMEIPRSQRRIVAQETGANPDKMDWLDIARYRNLRKSCQTATATAY
jgi:putative DNA primase/helicase